MSKEEMPKTWSRFQQIFKQEKRKNSYANKSGNSTPTPIKQGLNGLAKRTKFLQLAPEQKEKLSVDLAEKCRPTPAYWVSILLSSIIATFGLLQNSAAVVIGAMLVAPLLRPIELIAFGIANGQSGKVVHALRTIILSTIVAIGIALFVTYLVPIRAENAEILARTAPNLLDLFVALASAVVVFLALSFTRFSDAIAGVAMAAALMPPLAVVGIEITLGNLAAAGGAFFLYITNLVAIIIVGTVIFFLYGFTPHQKEQKQRTIKNFIILAGLLALIAVSLFYSLKSINQQITVEKTARELIEDTLARELPAAVLEDFDLLSFNKTSVNLFGSIKLPENRSFFAETKKQLTETLGTNLGRDVNLELEIIPTASIVSREQLTEQLTTVEQIDQRLRTFLRTEKPETTLISLNTFVSKDDDKNFTTQILLSIPADSVFPQQKQKELTDKFNQQIAGNDLGIVSINWGLVPQLNELNAEEVSQVEKEYQELSAQLEAFFNNELPEGVTVAEYQLDWEFSRFDSDPETETDTVASATLTPVVSGYNLQVSFYVPEDNKDLRRQVRDSVLAQAEELFSVPTQIDLSWLEYQTETLQLNSPAE